MAQARNEVPTCLTIWFLRHLKVVKKVRFTLTESALHFHTLYTEVSDSVKLVALLQVVEATARLEP